MLPSTSFNIIYIFFQMASQDSLRFFARTISQQGKGGKTERERGKKKARFPTLPSPLFFFSLSPSLCFLNQKKKKKPGETEQMLKNRFLKITVNQS